MSVTSWACVTYDLARPFLWQAEDAADLNSHLHVVAEVLDASLQKSLQLLV